MTEHQNDFEVHIDETTNTRTVLFRIADGFGHVNQLQELLSEESLDWLPDTNGTGGILSIRNVVDPPTRTNDLATDQLTRLRDMFANGDYRALRLLLDQISGSVKITADQSALNELQQRDVADLLAFFGSTTAELADSNLVDESETNNQAQTSRPLSEEERLAKVKEIAKNPKAAITRIDTAIGESSEHSDQQVARELMLYAQACGRSKADKKAKAIKDKFPDRERLIGELKKVGF